MLRRTRVNLRPRETGLQHQRPTSNLIMYVDRSSPLYSKKLRHYIIWNILTVQYTKGLLSTYKVASRPCIVRARTTMMKQQNTCTPPAQNCDLSHCESLHVLQAVGVPKTITQLLTIRINSVNTVPTMYLYSAYMYRELCFE